MTKIKVGAKAIQVVLPSIDGYQLDTQSLNGRPYMISFFRFASCPFCNMRVHQLVSRYEEFGKDFTIVAVFDSPMDNLTKYIRGHKAPFPILADEKNQFYQAYGIEKSIAGVIKGMIFRIPTLIKGMMKGYLPFEIKGNMITMPADFLIDRRGFIVNAYYGKDEGDHLPIDEVINFSQ